MMLRARAMAGTVIAWLRATLTPEAPVSCSQVGHRAEASDAVMGVSPSSDCGGGVVPRMMSRRPMGKS